MVNSNDVAVSKTMTSFYRRLFVAHLIDSGIDTVPAIITETGMPRRTAQDTIAALQEIGINCEFNGPTKSGRYEVRDWGPIRPSWINSNLRHIKDVLEYP